MDRFAEDIAEIWFRERIWDLLAHRVAAERRHQERSALLKAPSRHTGPRRTRRAKS